jgi:PAS domain-containing protein
MANLPGLIPPPALAPIPGNAGPIPHYPVASGSRANSFSQVYADEALDPCSRNYQGVMTRFDANRPDAINSVDLFAQVIGLGDNQLQAYLICGISVGLGPRIYCLHLPTKFLPALDGRSSPWDNLSFAFLGEVVQGQATNVVFPREAFDAVTTWVPALEYMEGHLATLTPDSPLFPPREPNDQDAEEIATRRLMYLPAVYVPLFLNASGYTPKQAWEILLPAVTQRQEREICRPLLSWLQVASTGVALAAQQMGDPTTALPLCSPPADEVLMKHRLRVLHHVLPALTGPTPSLETALSQMASALITQTNDNRLVRAEKEAAEAEPKLPSSKFKDSLPVLLDALQIADERNLPPIWHKWSNCNEKQELQMLKETLETFARSPQAYSATVPIVTSKMTQDLLAFNFVGDSADDIKMGFHPFIVTDGNAEHRQANRELARLYGYLQSGEASISLADLETLQAKEVRSVPLTYWELEKALGAFGNLTGVVLGDTHPLSIAYRAMWTLIQSTLRDDLHAAIEYRAYVKPTHVLLSIQLAFYHWFAYRRSRLTPPAPDLAAMIHQILMQVYVLPHLPPALYTLAYPKRSAPHNTSGDASVPGIVATGSASNSSSSGAHSSDGASTISGLTGSSAATLIPPGGRGAYISNLAPLASIKALDKPNVKLRDLIGTTSPPKMTDGTEMCLSYHLRGGCWSNCRRAKHHGMPLSPVEVQRLEQYITARLAAVAPAPTASSG